MEKERWRRVIEITRSPSLLRKYIVSQTREMNLQGVGENLPLWVKVPDTVWESVEIESFSWDLPRGWEGLSFLKQEMKTRNFLSRFPRLNWFCSCPPSLLERLEKQGLKNTRPRTEEERCWINSFRDALVEQYLPKDLTDSEFLLCSKCCKNFG